MNGHHSVLTLTQPAKMVDLLENKQYRGNTWRDILLLTASLDIVIKMVVVALIPLLCAEDVQ